LKKYIRRKEVISGKLDEELVMMDIEKGKYFALNPVATRIWDLLENVLSLEDLCDLLMEEYDVNKKQCHEEVEEHLKEMVKMKLIKVLGVEF
jgi:hypothetical protein